MSQRAICLATRDWLVERFGWAVEECDVTVDGAPKAMSGQTFVGVHGGGYTNDAHDSLDEMHSVLVTVTLKVGSSPADRIASEVVFGDEVGLEAIANKIKAAIHMDARSKRILTIANQYVAAESRIDDIVYGFSEPLFFRACSRPTKRGPEWVGGDGAGFSGLSLTLTFGGARRLSSLEMQD